MRSAHVAAIAQRPDVARFHFLDETGLRLDYTRRYGRAQAGQRVSGAVPLRRPARSLTLIGALSVHGLHGVQVLEGALNQRSFALYISRILAPQLRRGDVLVLDNLRVHHLTGLREWLARRGIEVLFLPPYSPDFTPIEQAWSKLKTKLRHAQARTRDALEEALHTAIDWLTGPDAKAWFNHCGYHVHRS
ncbi:IS630 family transposase (plasmid) [Hymenobacter sp. BRD128]|nr:IS630 family transposase [Hymenobacter sp. BRD128]QKG56377.1 IS630 family transposase [Hymenobacter sp. BRD128]QKG56603.1 IS630 family transposase [Hymenobacter sp. BRD128]QKG57333.1 IS630 family transposase [Hymenobacter sp. BRD128]QKG59251.1 IS630 family transposase [Hymenobacter sp. BRD128]